jgi:hypothetical protein
MAESDWVAPERHVKLIDMISAVGFLIYLADYPLITPETKFPEARLLFIVVFGASVYILSLTFDGDTNAVY